VRPARPALLLLALGCAPDVDVDGDDAATQVTLLGGDRFSLLVARDGDVVGGLSPGCPALRVGLRLPSDSGDTFIDVVRDPGGDATVVTGGRAVVDEGSAVVDLVDGDGGVVGVAHVVVGDVDVDGFVDVDVDTDLDDVDVAYVSVCFGLAPDEHVVGGGERFSGPDLRGTVTPLVFLAPGETESGTNEAHVPVPFFATTRGLGVLVDSEAVGAFDVGVSVANGLEVRLRAPRLPLRVRAAAPSSDAGSKVAERVTDNVAAHARRMGLPKPPPRWALLPMQWRNDLETEQDENGALTSTGTDMLLNDVAVLTALALPFSTVWIDAPWETGYNTFVVNDVQLPGFDDAMATLDDHGLHAIAWATEHINTSDDSGQAVGMPSFASRALFERFRDSGFLVETESGEPFTFPWGRGQGAFVDFSNPAACDAYVDEMRPLLQRGIRGFKLDYGESMRPDILGLLENTLPVFSDGSTTATMHTRYARLYHECYIQALNEVHGDDWFIITRTGGIYDQKNGVAIWPGDIDADFGRFGDGDAFAVGGIPSGIGGFLSLAMSGYPLYGADIGGYRGGRVTAEAFSRWAEFSSLSTIFQVGGGSNQAPWDRDLDVVSAEFAVSARRKAALWPMFESWIAQASRGGDGTPVVVPLGVFMGQDAAAWADREAFVVGDVLAAYPVVAAGARERAARLPAGFWYGLDDTALGGRQLAGPSLVTLPAPLGSFPILLRAGGVLVRDDTSETVLPTSVRVGESGRRVVVVAPGDDVGDDRVVEAGGVVVDVAHARDGDASVSVVDYACGEGIVVDAVVFLARGDVDGDGSVSVDGNVTRVSVVGSAEGRVTLTRRGVRTAP
jgi:alpha-D-xyloside xylohydrolase